MSKKVGIILSITAAIIIIVILIMRISIYNPQSDIDSFDDVDVFKDSVYMLRNTDYRGFLIKIDAEGHVKKMYNLGSLAQDYGDEVCNDGENLIVMSENHEDQYTVDMNEDDPLSKSVVTEYKIHIFDESLNRLKETPGLGFPEDEKIVNMRADGAQFYIVTLAVDGSKAKLYTLSKDAATEVTTGPKDEVKISNQSDEKAEVEAELLYPESMLVRESPNGRFFVDADYDKGALAVRMDNEGPEGIFQIKANIREIVSRTKLSFLQKMIIQRNITDIWLPLSVIGILIIVAFLIAIVGRNRVVYTAVIVEMVLVGILMSNFYFTTNEIQSTSVRESARFVIISLQSLGEDLGNLETVDKYAEDFYDSSDYRRLQKKLSEFVTKAGNSSLFYDCMLVDLNNSQSFASAGGKNKQDVSEIYGREMGSVISELKNGSTSSMSEFEVNGKKFFCMGMTDQSSKADTALMAVAVDRSMEVSLWGDRRTTVSNYVMIFVIGSLLCLFIIYIQGEDMRLFEKAIARVAGLDTNVERPILLGRDMVAIWNSLSEIAKQIDKMNYVKYRIYEAYYRFAPKHIETILKKTSITEVVSGDSINVKGTLAFAATGFNCADDLVNFLGEKADKEKQGIIVSSNSDLNLFKILFLQENTEVTSFGIDYIKRGISGDKNSGQTVLLYFGGFKYGVSGTEDQSFAYLTSDENQELEKAVKWLKDRKLGLVITEDVKLREAIDYKTRYIGYLELSVGKIRLNLYEVLDACPARDRQLKLFYLDRFDKALELFYRKDFYLARSEFSEILKGFPEDEIVRWYLFESERCLNDENSVSESGALGGSELAVLRRGMLRIAGDDK